MLGITAPAAGAIASPLRAFVTWRPPLAVSVRTVFASSGIHTICCVAGTYFTVYLVFAPTGLLVPNSSVPGGACDPRVPFESECGSMRPALIGGAGNPPASASSDAL